MGVVERLIVAFRGVVLGLCSVLRAIVGKKGG